MSIQAKFLALVITMNILLSFDLGRPIALAAAPNSSMLDGGRRESKQRMDDGFTETTQLLRLCAQGNNAAFRRLYELQSPRLYGIALRVMQQPALASDAVHDVFVQVWQRSAQFDPSRNTGGAWLASMVRYRAIDILRRRGREQYRTEPAEEVDTSPDALAQLAEQIDGVALHRCLAELQEGQRRVVLLAFMDGLSHVELAARLQAPLGTVKSWVRRALLSLRRCLEA